MPTTKTTWRAGDMRLVEIEPGFTN